MSLLLEVNKENPFPAPLLERKCLNKSGSSKEVYHVRLDIRGSGLLYQPGDCVAVLPENDPERVALIEKALGTERFHETLLKKVNIDRVPGSFLDTVTDRTFAHPRDRLAYLKERDLLDIVQENAIDLTHFEAHLSRLLPRFYSIASASPDHIDLLIRTFSYQHAGKELPGTASDFICRREIVTLPLYLHPTKHFLLPPSDETPIILIGPGTGVAPFRAFLEKRTQGKNWLFFGERSREMDFYYEDFFSSHPALRLTTAFSRDQAEKIYVQHRLLEERQEVRAWIDAGAHIYICGDAAHMAKDVQEALKEITQSDLKALRRDKRLLLDVY